MGYQRRVHGGHSNKFNSLIYSFVRVLFKQLIIKMMKIAVLAFALFAAVIAEPEAEASPDAYYGYAGYGHGYGHGYGYGLYGRYGYGGYGYGGYGRGYGYGHYLGKRSADADAEASPALFYGAYGHPFHYGVHPYAYAPLRLAGASSYQHVSTPAATHGIHQLHKREAEADASQTHTTAMPDTVMVMVMDTHDQYTVMAVTTEPEPTDTVVMADTDTVMAVN